MNLFEERTKLDEMLESMVRNFVSMQKGSRPDPVLEKEIKDQLLKMLPDTTKLQFESDSLRKYNGSNEGIFNIMCPLNIMIAVEYLKRQNNFASLLFPEEGNAEEKHIIQQLKMSLENLKNAKTVEEGNEHFAKIMELCNQIKPGSSLQPQVDMARITAHQMLNELRVDESLKHDQYADQHLLKPMPGQRAVETEDDPIYASQLYLGNLIGVNPNSFAEVAVPKFVTNENGLTNCECDPTNKSQIVHDLILAVKENPSLCPPPTPGVSGLPGE